MSKNIPIMALEPTLNKAVVGPPMLSTWGAKVLINIATSSGIIINPPGTLFIFSSILIFIG